MHMSVLDFAKWAAWQVVGREKLHTPVIDTRDKENAPPGTPKTGEYALGWGEVRFDWSPAVVMTHTGSNRINLATVMSGRKILDSS